MVTLGYMPMPADFRYKEIAELGKPDPSGKHPLMDTVQRAKIFAPFAALRGFDQAILSKNVQYKTMRSFSEEEQDEMNRRLSILRGLTFNGYAARRNRPVVTLTYFSRCVDRNSEAYGDRGSYCTLTDIVWRVDPIQQLIRIGTTDISFCDICSIEATDIFTEEEIVS